MSRRASPASRAMDNSESMFLIGSIRAYSLQRILAPIVLGRRKIGRVVGVSLSYSIIDQY